MNIAISGHHISITEAMREAVIDKLSKVERHFDQIQSIKVILSLDNNHTIPGHSGKNNHKAEAMMRVAGQELFVHAYDDDMYKAIGDMAEKLDRQVRKCKTRLEHKPRSSRRSDNVGSDFTNVASNSDNSNSIDGIDSNDVSAAI